MIGALIDTSVRSQAPEGAVSGSAGLRGRHLRTGDSRSPQDKRAPRPSSAPRTMTCARSCSLSACYLFGALHQWDQRWF